MERYARQARFSGLGPEGQERIGRSRVTVVGCGALGSVAAELLARAGVGALRLVDRDVVDASNLHRVALYTEADVESGLPKAPALATRLLALRADLEVEPLVADFDGANALELLDGCDLVLDGTDNFEARHVLNEAALATRRPWVHAACLGATALAWPLVPGRGACYACLVPEAPAPGEAPTCETAGVIGPAVHLAASLQVAEALKLLAGREADLLDGPWSLDAWTAESSRVRARPDPDCPACARGERRLLGRARRGDAVACGRSAVQLAAEPGAPRPRLEEIARRLSGRVPVRSNEFLVRFPAGEGEITVFGDGRVLVSGTRDVTRARTLVAQYLGA